MNTFMRNFSLVAFALIISAGCGSQKAQVTGIVQRDGQVIPGGSVLFRPLSSDIKPAVGEIQSDGKFQMMTESPGDGVMIGKYRVVIAGKRGAEDPALNRSYLGPNDKPVEVTAGKNEIVINVSEADGWETMGGTREATGE
jgi:hypothetical protein